MLTISELRAINMNIFSKLDYRHNLKMLVENRKKIDSSVTFQRMAEYMRIQKAYLSQVIKGHRDLSQDQLYMAMEYLDLKEHEKNFLQLSLEYERSGLVVRQRELKKQLKQMQKKYSKTSTHIEVDEVQQHGSDLDAYFLDPYNMLVHMCLYVKKLKQDPKEIAYALMIPVDKVQKCLQQLQKIAVIDVDNGKIKIIKDGIHIPKESPLFQVWRTNLNSLSQQRIQTVDQNKRYNFQVSFAAKHSSIEEIQDEFMKFLKKTKKIADAADGKEEEVIHMAFDLFSWTESF